MGSSTATAVPPAFYQTGVISEERSLVWKITNFPVILKKASMVNSQRFEFYAGDSIGMRSKWMAYLYVQEETDGVIWAGVYLKVKERPAAICEHLFVEFVFTFKDKDGVAKKRCDTKLVDWYDATVIQTPTDGYGFKIFKMNVEEGAALPWYSTLLEEGSLVIHVTFKIYAMSKPTSPLTEKLAEFEVKSMAKAKEDLTLLMAEPVAANDIRIVANDKGEFKMQRDILSARSPVFQAMLATDMMEGNRRRIEIPDMGSQSLKTMLHFLYRGELLPEWTMNDVLPELTNAAGKYQLMDLLQFLDGVLGSVCSLHNVGALIPLAHRLSLKTAEADLLSFMRRKGANSAEDFVRVCHGILTLDSKPVVKIEELSEDEGDPPSRSRKGRRGSLRKRNPCQSDEDSEEPRRSKRSRKAKELKE